MGADTPVIAPKALILPIVENQLLTGQNPGNIFISGGRIHFISGTNLCMISTAVLV